MNAVKVVKILFCLFFLLMFYCALPTFEKSPDIKLDIKLENKSDNNFIFDKVGLLSQENFNDIHTQAQKIYATHNVAVYTIVVESMPEKKEINIDYYVMDYAKKFKNTLSISNDTVILFICMEKGNRWREILAFGSVHKKLTNSRLRSIQNIITPNLTAGSYYTAINAYYTSVEIYIKQETPINYIAHGVILLISLGIAGALVHYLVKIAGGEVTVSHRTYSSNTAKVTHTHAQHLYTTKTKIKSSSSGGGGGSSRGGGGRF